MALGCLGTRSSTYASAEEVTLAVVLACVSSLGLEAVIVLLFTASKLPSWTKWPHIVCMITLGLLAVVSVITYFIINKRSGHVYKKRKSKATTPHGILLEFLAFLILILAFLSDSFVYMMIWAGQDSTVKLLLTSGETDSSTAILSLVIAVIAQAICVIFLDHVIDTHLREIPSSNFGGSTSGGGQGYNNSASYGGGGGMGGGMGGMGGMGGGMGMGGGDMGMY